MTRARDIANLGTQAGSGLDASDITTGVLPVGVTGGSGLNALTFPAGHTLKIYGPSFYNSSGGVVKSGDTAYTEIHPDFRVTVNDMLSSSNHLLFHYQAEFGCRSSGNSWGNYTVGESADYTTIYAGIVGFTGNTSGNMVEMGNAVAGADRYNINTFHIWSTGHSGSKTFSPIYSSQQSNSIRGAGGPTNVQYFQVYEIQA